MNNTHTLKKKKRRRFKDLMPLYIMLLPGIIYLFINNYMPMTGIIIAFKQVNFAKGILNSPFIGLKNFEFLFRTKDAWIITRNTLLYNLAFIILNMIVGIFIAVLIVEIKHLFAKKIYQSAILVPFLMSTVILSYIVFALFSSENGMINNSILKLLGKDPISWYNEPKYWPAILILTNLWKSVGYGCLIYIASIIGIDKSLYEAAQLDGAGRWKRIRYITLPSLLPTIIILTLLSVGRIFYSDFGLFYQVPMNSGTLLKTTNVIDTYVYRSLMQLGNIGMASAAGVYQSVVGFIVVLLSNWFVRKVDDEKALF
ncbi:sugar ABC transporter permease [Vallitalea pronyensis]|uniref:Sugar ABC transporter permease n=1 Tax=Vallitalea pronyensis TaxID=1348613 RepID=A0A8J8SIB8_9FIRM|nr:ABC transporter permease subunit [Vallitalea pronyensis]QUI24282.1 sugar ABC transporter permease [Vallitalea pronyensis]